MKRKVEYEKKDIERIVKGKYVLDHNMDGDAVVGPVDCVSRDKVLQTLNKMKTAKAHGHSNVSLQWVTDRGEVINQVMVELCQSSTRIYTVIYIYNHVYIYITM